MQRGERRWRQLAEVEGPDGSGEAARKGVGEGAGSREAAAGMKIPFEGGRS